MQDKEKIWEIIERSLGLIAVISLFLFVYLNMSVELRDPDIWLHLKTGEYIVQHRTIPQQDIFSSTLSGKKWLDHSWLVQVIFYLVFHFAGPDNLILLSAITVTLAFLFLFLTFAKPKALILNLTVLFIAIFASIIRFNIRPENFSILFFSLCLFILIRHIRDKWVFLLPLIQLIWVNCHGFFIFGPLLVGVFILAHKLKQTKVLPWGWNEVGLLDRRSYQNLISVFYLACFASFLNPYGYKGALYPLWVTVTSFGKSTIFFTYIQELLPTWQLYYKSIAAYYILIAVSCLAFLLNFRRINLAHLIIWLIFLGISLRVNRNIIYFNFVAYLTTVDALLVGPDTKIERFSKRTKYLIKLTAVIIIIFWSITKGYSLLKSGYYIFEEDRVKSRLLGITAKEYPNKAVDFILKNDLPQNLFNLFNYGSYLIYRLYPEKKVFIDGRTELYGDDFFKNYQKIVYINKNTITELFKEYKINTVLVSGTSLEVLNLSSYFFNAAGWVLVYFDGYSAIFVKDTPQNRVFVDKLKVDLKHWQTLKADIDQIGMKNISPYPYINRARMFYYWGLDEQALSEAREALRILPSNSDAYNIIGRMYLKQKLYDLAFENLRLANIFAPSNIETLTNLGNFYIQKGEFEEAIRKYKRLTELNPCFSEGYYLLGRAFAKTNNLRQAIKLLERAIKLNPFKAQYYKELSELLYKNKDFKRAAQIDKKAIALGLDAS